MRVCLNCRHYDRSARWECREEISEAVRDKERANFCDAFQPRSDGSGATGGSGADELRRLAEALFKK